LNFDLVAKATPDEIVDAINYLLANLGSNSLVYNSSTGQITSGGVVVGYLYRYLWVKYSTSFNGSTGFSDSPTNATYYGLHNSNSNAETANPSDYIWTAANFGTTNYLWYQTTGGNQIAFFVGSTQPNGNWAKDNVAPIDLYSVTSVSSTSINQSVVIMGMDGEDGQDGMMIPAPRVSSYGELEIINNATGTVCTLQNTFYPITAGWTAGDSQNYVAGSSNLTSSLGGPAYTVCSASLQTTSSNQNYNIQIFKNGIAIPGHNGMMRLTNSTDVNTITCSGVIGSVKAGDVFDIRIQNQSSAAQTVTVIYANFCMVNI
jgi:hypothetical protein